MNASPPNPYDGAQPDYQPAGFDIFPTFVTPMDVAQRRARLDPMVRALDITVSTCTTLRPETKQGWRAFSKTWRDFMEEEPSWWHAKAMLQTLEGYENNVRDWQLMISKQCGLDSPVVRDPAEGAASLTSTIRTVAIAGCVVAGLLLVRSLVAK